MIFNFIQKAKEVLYKNGKSVEVALDEVNENFKKYLPLTGGIVTGDVKVNTSKKDAVIDLKSDNARVILSAQSDENGGLKGVYDAEEYKWIVSSDKDGKVRLGDKSLEDYLPLDGGTMKGSVAFASPYQGQYFKLKNGDTIRLVSTDNLGSFAMIYVNSGGVYKATVMNVTPKDDQSGVETNFNGNLYGMSTGINTIGGAGNILMTQAYVGTKPSDGRMYVKADYNNKFVTVGILGLGEVGVNRAKCDRYGNTIDETYAKVQKGTGTVYVSSATTTPVYVDITFAKEFSSVPTVLLDSAYRPFLSISNVTKTGFRVSGYNPYTFEKGSNYYDGFSDNAPFTWVAIE